MHEKNFRFLLNHKVYKVMNQNTMQTTDQHQQISLLLPWYLNQSLEPAERQRVENHLRSCMLCRRELVYLNKLAATVKQASDLDAAAEISFDGLREKLQTAQQSRQQSAFSVVTPVGGFQKRTHSNPSLSGSAPDRRKPFWTFLGFQGTRLAVAASLLLAIIPFAVQYGRSLSTSGYYTLSDVKPEASSGFQLRVVFSKSISDSSIDALLAQIHGQRVEGPNSVGAYTVRLDSGKDASELTTVIAFLRSQQDVLLAEPVLNHP